MTDMTDRLLEDLSSSCCKQEAANYANVQPTPQSLSRDSNKRKASQATLSNNDHNNSDEPWGNASFLSEHRKEYDKVATALPNAKRLREVNVDSYKSVDSAANSKEMGMAQMLEVLLDREQQQEQQAAVPSTTPATVKSMTTLDDAVLDHGTKPLQSNHPRKRTPTTPPPPPPPPLQLSEKQMKAAAAPYGFGQPVAAQISRPSNPVVYLVSHPMPQAVSLSLQPPPQANVLHHRNAGTMYHNISNSTNHITPNSFVNGYNSVNTMNNNMNNSMFIDVTANTHAVFIGFVRHPGTKEWRDTIKTFSQNFKDYPSWSDDIFEKIRTKLREKGITAYFICRKPHLSPSQFVREGDVGAAVEKKKIFDKNKNYTGKWDHATGQEILDRTKERFVDDRKPIVAFSNVFHSLHRLFAGWMEVLTGTISSFIRGCKATSGGDVKRTRSESRGNLRLVHEVGATAALDSVDVHAGMSALNVPTLNNRALPQNDMINGSNPAQHPATTQLRFTRQPVHVEHINGVYFGKRRHPGTQKCLQIVKQFAENFPEWTETVCTLIKSRLAEENITDFFVFLTNEGRPSDSIEDGLWYRATDDEFAASTLMEFHRARQSLVL